MAHVRSVEQQYWNLAQAHVQLWSADRAVSLAEEILKREQAELVVGRGTVADVAEAAQRLEQFNLDLVTRTSDVITTERQLRNILGLPPADNRRIIPVTPPTEARLEPDWDASLAQMLNFQPDIVQQQLLVRVAELQFLIARNQLLPQLNLNALYQFNGLGQQLDSAEAVMTGAALKALEPGHRQPADAPRASSRNPGNYNNFVTWQVGFTFQTPLGMRSPLANTRQAQYILLRARAYLAAGRPPDDPLAGPVLPGNRRQLQAVQDGLAAAGRRRPAARRPASLLRGRPDHDRPLPRRRQPVCHRRGDRGPVQDDLQHLDRRPGRGQGNPAGLRQHRRGRRARIRGRPTSRPATSRMPISSSTSRPTVRRFPSRRSARSIPTRSTTNPPPGVDRPGKSAAAAWPRRARWTAPPRRCRRTPRPASCPILSQTTPGPGSAQPAAGTGTAPTSDVSLTSGAIARQPAAVTRARLIDPTVPGMGATSVAASLGRTGHAGCAGRYRRLGAPAQQPRLLAAPVAPRSRRPRRRRRHAGVKPPAADDLPPLPVSIDLPPLPPS